MLQPGPLPNGWAIKSDLKFWQLEIAGINFYNYPDKFLLCLSLGFSGFQQYLFRGKVQSLRITFEKKLIAADNTVSDETGTNNLFLSISAIRVSIFYNPAWSNDTLASFRPEWLAIPDPETQEHYHENHNC